MDVELAEIRDFLAAHAPFDRLPSKVLGGLPRRCTLRYARRGSVVLDVGDRGDGLYVVRSGAVEVRDETGDLIDRVGTGEAFGMSSLLEHRPTRYRCTAVEDTLLLVLEAEAFEEISRAHADFATFYAVTHHTRLSRAIGNLQRATSGGTVLGTRIGDLITREPVTTALTATVAEAAATMSRAGVSSILVVADGDLRGIMTDRDLRNRVLAIGLDSESQVQSVMTSEPVTLLPDALAFEALLEMVSRDIHHLPVVDDAGRPVGLVTTTDLIRLENANPVYLAAAIGGQTTVAGVVAEAPGISAVLGQLVERDVTAADISRVATALGDAVRRRVVMLVEEQLGPPPVPYSWVVLGSAAREEEGFTADQDHAIVLGEATDEAGDAWFADLAEQVTSALEKCGWPRCPGGVMATNPHWRLSVEQWRQQFAAVVARARARCGAALGDLPRHAPPRRRPAAGRAGPSGGGLDGLPQAVGSPVEAGPGHACTAGVLPRAGAGAARRPPRHARHQAPDLRGGPARAPLLPAGRVTRPVDAASAGCRSGGRAARPRAGRRAPRRARADVVPETAPPGGTGACGPAADNNLAPANLSQRQRRHLRDAFAIVRSAQNTLSSHLPPGFE